MSHLETKLGKENSTSMRDADADFKTQMGVNNTGSRTMFLNKDQWISR